MDNAIVGNKIKKLRREQGLTQQDIAKIIGKTESSIRKYEKGLVNIPMDVIVKLANALNVKAYDLVGENADKIEEEMFLKESLDWLTSALSDVDYYNDEDRNRHTDLSTLLEILNFAYKDEINGYDIISDIRGFACNILYRYGYDPLTFKKIDI